MRLVLHKCIPYGVFASLSAYRFHKVCGSLKMKNFFYLIPRRRHNCKNYTFYNISKYSSKSYDPTTKTGQPNILCPVSPFTVKQDDDEADKKVIKCRFVLQLKKTSLKQIYSFTKEVLLL